MTENRKSSSSQTENPGELHGLNEGGAADEAVAVSADDNDGVNDNNEDSTDVWGSSEGYTPLAAWAQAGGGNGLFSMGPSSDDGGGGGGGTFFANLQAFAVAASHSSSEDEEDYREHSNGDDYQAVANTPEAEDEDTSFRNLADQALLALEDDYRLTLQGEKSSFPSFPSQKDSNGGELNPEQEDAYHDVEALPNSFAADFDAARAAHQVSHVNDDHAFSADFSNLPKTDLPPIDADKVRHAVQNLQLRPNFQKQMQQWERQQKRLAALAPIHHQWIPDSMCRAFRQANKAGNDQKHSSHVATTQKFSRACTLMHALYRLDLISLQTEHLEIHLLGCDQVEAGSREQLMAHFGPLVAWMQHHARKPPRTIHLHLIGPSLPSNNQMCGIELVEREESHSNSRLESLQVSIHPGYYHEWRQKDLSSSAHLLMAFHPGFWGYDTWKATLNWLLEKADNVPLVATSYTLLEAEEDQEVLQGLSSSGNVTKIWEAEYNPFASQQVRPTATGVEGEEYRENSAWQAWRI